MPKTVKLSEVKLELAIKIVCLRGSEDKKFSNVHVQTTLEHFRETKDVRTIQRTG